MVYAKCHSERQHEARGFCKYCYHTWRRRNNPKVREQHRQDNKRYHRENHDKVLKYWAKYRKRKGKDGIRNDYLLRTYGISLDHYRKLVKKQKGKCALCGKLPKRDLVVDHNHTTGKLRELLCDGCNGPLGKLENKQWLKLAERYLRKHKS